MRSHPTAIPLMTGTPAPTKNLKPVHRLLRPLRRAAGESAIARLTRALLLLAVIVFTVLAVKSIMGGSDARIQESADRASHGATSHTSK